MGRPSIENDVSRIAGARRHGLFLCPSRRSFSSLLANSWWASLLVYLLCWPSSGVESFWLGSSPRCRPVGVLQAEPIFTINNANDVSQWKEKMVNTKIRLMDADKSDIKNTCGDLVPAVSEALRQTVGAEAGKIADVTGKIITDLTSVPTRNPYVALGNVIRVVGGVTTLVALVTPLGPIVPAIMGPLCKLASSVLIGGQGDESIESKLENVVAKAFLQYQQDERSSEAFAVIERLRVRMRILDGILKSTNVDNAGAAAGDNAGAAAGDAAAGDNADAAAGTGVRISNYAATLISGSEFMTDGIYEQERLWYFIESTKEGGEVAAEYLFFYVMISVTRMQQLTLLSCLYEKIGANALASTVQSVVKARIDFDGKRLGDIFDPEADQSKNSVYRAIHDPAFHKRAVIESYANVAAGEGVTGRLIQIKLKPENAFLQCKADKEHKKTSLKTQNTYKVDGTLFRYFKENHRLFSCNQGSYVFPDQKSGKKHYVYAYHNAHERKNLMESGEWHLPDNVSENPDKVSGKITFRCPNGDENYLYKSPRGKFHPSYKRLKTSDDHNKADRFEITDYVILDN